jgi:hypothetical protein
VSLLCRRFRIPNTGTTLLKAYRLKAVDVQERDRGAGNMDLETGLLKTFQPLAQQNPSDDIDGYDGKDFSGLVRSGVPGNRLLIINQKVKSFATRTMEMPHPPGRYRFRGCNRAVNCKRHSNHIYEMKR